MPRTRNCSLSLAILYPDQGVAPQTYLADVIRRVPGADPNELDQLTPANWANDFKARQQQELQRTA
ncbi:hypothetical protein N8586_01895 [Verrucomicrobiales bacterium]|nr:hypothetical protein [Verrucomicrobiales bacterium]